MPDESWWAKVEQQPRGLHSPAEWRALVEDRRRTAEKRLTSADLETLERGALDDIESNTCGAPGCSAIEPEQLVSLIDEVRGLRAIAREMIKRNGDASYFDDGCVFCRGANITEPEHAAGCPWPLLLLSLPPEQKV